MAITSAELNHKIGRRLRFIRLMRGLSQMALAGNAGISIQQLQQYETGTEPIPAALLVHFGELLVVPLTEFANFRGAPRVVPRYLSEESPLLQQMCQAYTSLDTDLKQAVRVLIMTAASAGASDKRPFSQGDM